MAANQNGQRIAMWAGGIAISLLAMIFAAYAGNLNNRVTKTENTQTEVRVDLKGVKTDLEHLKDEVKDLKAAQMTTNEGIAELLRRSP